ncbi:MAG: hypothetical protein HQL31_03750 [Planctomycetes bacterium]|nr:hypothetical protein [Planctomycetota bacterium]
MIDLNNRVALGTGASRGLSAAIAGTLASQRVRVILALSAEVEANFTTGQGLFIN